MKIALRRYNQNGLCMTNEDIGDIVSKPGFYIIDTFNRFVKTERGYEFIKDQIKIHCFTNGVKTTTVELNKYSGKLLNMMNKKFSRKEISSLLNTSTEGFGGKNLNADLKTKILYHHPVLTFYRDTGDAFDCFDVEICSDTPETNEELNKIVKEEFPNATVSFEKYHNYICLKVDKSKNFYDVTLFIGRRLYKDKLSFGVSRYFCKNLFGEIHIDKPFGTVQKCEQYINDNGRKCYDKHVAYILIFEPMKVKLFDLMRDFEKIGTLDE